MPVWHEAAKKWTADGKLVVLGITQEQHPQRCRLFAQWKQFGWPILHDPLNLVESLAVPIIVAIDEHGIVRAVGPKIKTFERDFLNKTFADNNASRPAELIHAKPDNFDTLRRRSQTDTSATNWRTLGDALVLWGGAERTDEAIDCYANAVRIDPSDGNSHFRLGVCYRARYDSENRHPSDFQQAVDSWSRALATDPNRYIWRRRIQQYGPRLDKPYPFYDWVETALGDVKERGEKPVALGVMPSGAEIAHPTKRFHATTTSTADESSPDPKGLIHRDTDSLIEADVTVVPRRMKAGGTARVHITLRPGARNQAHWNNENEPLRVWIDAPDGWLLERRLLSAPLGQQPETREARHLEFELKPPSDAHGTQTLSAYALYYVCDDAGGQCLYLRQDLPITVTVDR